MTRAEVVRSEGAFTEEDQAVLDHCGAENNPFNELLEHLKQGELDKALALQEGKNYDFRSTGTLEVFRDALRQCIVIQMQRADGMRTGELVIKLYRLSGRLVDFSGEEALVTDFTRRRTGQRLRETACNSTENRCESGLGETA